MPNAAGLMIQAGTVNFTVGGTAAGAGNLIAGNAGDGLVIDGATAGTIQGNRIGTDRTGTAAIPNRAGLTVGSGSTNILVGGTTAAARNIISGNADAGVKISGAATTAIVLQGNFIGTDVTGSVALGNTGTGVSIATAGNTVGGTTAGASNIISGNALYGVFINEVAASGNLVQGNFIGTNAAYDPTPAAPASGDEVAAGTLDLGNMYGVLIYSAPNNTVGGTAAGAGNVISGNNGAAYTETAGVWISGPTATGNLIQGNRIGTNAAGTAALPNVYGVCIRTPNNTVGGLTAGAGNLISGNLNYGVPTNANNTAILGNIIGLAVDGSTPIGGQGVAGIYSGFTSGTWIAQNVISGNSGGGIRLRGGSGNRVEGNLIGTDQTGTLDRGNAGHGIWVSEGETNSTVGGTTVAARNVISGNNADGIIITGLAGQITVSGNYIGLNAAGTGVVPNGGLSGYGRGVTVFNCPGNMIGGTAAGARNVISGNIDSGVFITGAASAGNVVAGNYIGTDAAGNANRGNIGHGVNIADAPNNTIGGTATGAGNVISGNGTLGVEVAGVKISGPTSTGNRVQGNKIGTNAVGTAAVPNVYGVYLFDAPSNIIGGPEAGAGNLIAGNANYGVILLANNSLVQGNLVGLGQDGSTVIGGHFVAGVYSGPGHTGNQIRGNVISGSTGSGVMLRGGSGNTVAGNLIGTDKTGTLGRGNSVGILVIEGATGSTIGGTTTVDRNVISGNDSDGVRINGPSGTITVMGNYIGLNATGTAALGNSGSGVLITGGSTANTIGGATVAAGNSLAFNAGAGVQVTGGSGSTIRLNSLYSNGGLGIDLGAAGVTPNDLGDGDSGPNNLQNFPLLSNLSVLNGEIRVGGTLDSVANGGYTIDFYSSPTPDPSGYGQGKTYLGSVASTTFAGGDSSFLFRYTGLLALNSAITATVTDSAGNTSEFSRWLANNQRPVARIEGGDQRVAVGSTATFRSVSTDPDGNPLSLTWTFGDGSPAVTGTSVTHNYAAAGSYGVVLTASDGFGGVSSDNVVAVVGSGVPVLDPLILAPINEGGVATLNGTFNDPDPTRSAGLDIDWGDLSTPTHLALGSGVRVFAGSHRYLDGTPSDFRVTVSLLDSAGLGATALGTQHVNNVAPTLTDVRLARTTIGEGEAARLTGTVLDPGTNDGQTIEINWGDGLQPATTTIPLLPGQTTFEAVRTYGDVAGPGSSSVYAIGLTVRDKDGASASAGTTITVRNLAPSVSVVSTPASTTTGLQVQALVADPGVLDRFNYAWSVGPGGLTGQGPTFGFPTSALGTYNLVLTVTDKNGASSSFSTLVVVGSDQSDRITLTPAGAGQVNVTINGSSAILAAADVLVVGLGGDDVIDARAVAVPVILDGGPGADFLYGGGGNDTLVGGLGSDWLDAGQGNNLFLPDPDGINTLTGGSGNDTYQIVGNVLGGDPILYDSGGLDTLDFSRNGAGVTVDLNVTAPQTFDAQGTGNSLTLNGQFEDVIGTAGNDTISANNLTGSKLVGGSGNDRLYGGSGNDQLYAGDGSSTLVAGRGNDQLYGGAGNTSMSGGAGNATMYGGYGNASMGGGTGNATMYGSYGNTSMGGGTGNSTMYGSYGNTSMGGGAGNAAMYGSYGNTSMGGGSGNSTMYGSAGNTSMGGGSGNATMYGSYGNTSMGGGSGNATMYGSAGNTSMGGGTGNATMYGGYGNTSMGGGAGNATMYGSSGNTSMGGGSGNATMYGSYGNTSMGGGSGNATMYGAYGNTSMGGGSGNATMYGSYGNTSMGGGSGNATMYGSYGNTSMGGGSGNATMYGSYGNTSMGGGSGNATMYGSYGNTSMGGGSGNATMYGSYGNTTMGSGVGNSTMYGGSGNTTMLGGPGTDLMYGGPGRTTMYGGGGIDNVVGGVGDDTLIESADTDMVLSDSRLDAAGFGRVAFSGVERVVLIGGAGNNRLDASAATVAVELDGGAGDDTLIGGAGGDRLEGGAGDDLLIGNRGGDSYLFGPGNLGSDRVVEAANLDSDTLDFTGFSAPVVVDLGKTTPRRIGAGLLTLTLSSSTGIENVIGGAFDDTITGNDRANLLVGSGGVDALYGGGGDDILQAGRTQVVFLDFDSFGYTGAHAYTTAERDAIQARMAGQYADFTYRFTQARPTSGDFVTVDFNRPLGDYSGGSSSEIDWRNLNTGGTVTVDVNQFVKGGIAPPATAPTPTPVTGTIPQASPTKYLASTDLPENTVENIVGLSATIAAHELGHLSGLRHEDAFGAIGSGAFARIQDDPDRRYLPPFAGPYSAEETSDHLMGSPASIRTDLFAAAGSPFLGEREAIKLAFADHGSVAAEQADPHQSIATAQSLDLVGLAVPNPLLRGLYAGMSLAVTALDVVGSIQLDATGRSQDDYYGFEARAGDLFNIQVFSAALARIARPIDSILRVFDASGKVVPFYNSPAGAVVDDSFESQDASLLDLLIPADGRYYVEVDTYYGPGSDHQPIPDTAVGDYELFLTRFTTGGVLPAYRTELLDGGTGTNTLIGGSGPVTFANAGGAAPAFNSTTYTVDVAPGSVSIGPDRAAAAGSPVSLSASFGYPDASAVFTYLWHVQADNGQVVPDGTGASFGFTPTAAGAYTVSFVVTDPRGGTGRASATLTVAGAPPVAAIAGAASVGEGSPYQLNLSAQGFGAVGATSWSVDWGDGPAAETFVGNPSMVIHTYAEGSSAVTIHATASGAASTSASTSLSLVVNNVAPTARLVAPIRVGEASSFTLSLAFPVDPSAADTIAGFHYAFALDPASLASATYASSGTSAFSEAFPAGDGPRNQDVYARILDKDGGSTDYHAIIVVNDVAPAVAIHGASTAATAPTSATEGSSITLTATATDPSAADSAGGFTYDWSVTRDGRAYTTGSGSSFTFQPTGDGTYVVAVGATDRGGTGTATRTIAVSNVAPSASLTAPVQSVFGDAVIVGLVGASDPSTDDTSAGLRYVFGYSTSTASPLVGATYAGAGVTPSSSFASLNAGTYRVFARVIDQDGGFTEYSSQVTVAPRVLTASIVGNPTKVYDGKTDATLVGAHFGLTGLVGGDRFTVTRTSGVYNTKDVPTATTIRATLAATDFGATGSTLAANYVLPTTATGAGQITPAQLTGGFTASNKVYDGGKAAAIATRWITSGIVGGDSVTLTGGDAAFDTRNVGTGKTVTGVGFTLGGGDAGNYLLGTVATTTASVSGRGITGVITAADRTYDGTTSASIVNRTLVGQVNGDDVRYTGGTATFATRDAALSKTVMATGLSLVGADAGNYTVNPSATTTASIGRRGLTVVATGLNKVYDASDAATVTLADNHLAGDQVSATDAAARFDAGKNVGTAKAVSVSGIAISGADAGNYTVNATASTTADITRKVLTVKADDQTRVFGDPNPALSYTITGSVETGYVPSGGPDLSTAATTTSDAGSYAIATGPGTLAAANYSFATQPGTLTVLQKAATAIYTGNYYVATATASATTASVTLSATIRDNSGPSSYGDITRARVRFIARNNDTNAIQILTPPSPTLVNPSDPKVGTVQYLWSNVAVGSYTVSVVVGDLGGADGDYRDNDPNENTLVEVAQFRAGSSNGGGYLVNTNSSGLYPGDPGEKTSYSFGLKTGTTLTGNLSVVWHSGPKVYQFLGSSINSLTFPATAATDTGIRSASEATGLWQDVTNPKKPITLDAAARIELSTDDRGEPGRNDSIRITVRDRGSNVLYSNGGTEQVIGGGNIQNKVAEQAAGQPAPVGLPPTPLTPAQLRSIVAEAIRRWEAVGIDPRRIDALRLVNVRLDDLGGSDLGAAAPGEILIDRTGGGYGWFVDATPGDDSEFITTIATATGPAARHMDLLSVVAHELGHELGLAHIAGDDVMNEFLAPGVRHVPTTPAARPPAGPRASASALALAVAMGRAPGSILTLPLAKTVTLSSALPRSMAGSAFLTPRGKRPQHHHAGPVGPRGTSLGHHAGLVAPKPPGRRPGNAFAKHPRP
jgi:Ca2+-binding RTX toxin-like protein